MSETNNALLHCRVLPCLPVLAILSLFLPFAPVLGEGIPSYGLQMCEDAGIPANECTLAGGPWPEAEIVQETAAAEKGGKAETLDAHAALLCDQQGVPPADCMASRPTERLIAEEVQPDSAFVTPAERLPRLTATPLPEPVQGPVVVAPPPVILASPPRPTQQQAARFVSPSTASLPQQAIRESGLQPAPLLPSVGAFAVAPQPILTPPPAQPVFRDTLRPLPADGTSVRSFRERRTPIEPLIRDVRRGPVENTGRGFFEGLFDGRQTRCRREVRYSRPPSYRYVECF